MNNLPNLSTWHEVPRGATIPEGTRWAADFGGGVFGVYSHEKDTNDSVDTTKFYTEKPIERTLAQVIEDAYNNLGDWESAAQAARDFLAPKAEGPEYVIDLDNDTWILNNEGTYDCLTTLDSEYQGKTLGYISGCYGIRED